MFRRKRPNEWYDAAVRGLQEIHRHITGLRPEMPARAHLLDRYERIRNEVERLESRAFGVGDGIFEQDRNNTRTELDALLNDVQQSNTNLARLYPFQHGMQPTPGQADDWYTSADGVLGRIRNRLDALAPGERAEELGKEFRSLRARMERLKALPKAPWQRPGFQKRRAECNMQLNELYASTIKSSEDDWQQGLSTANQHTGDYARASLSDNVGIPVPGTGSRSDNRSAGSPPRRQRHQY